MPRPRPLARDELTPRRAEILDGVESLVLEHGPRGLRLADVAHRLNTSHQTLYQLARSKDELVLLAVDRWYQRAIDSAWQALAGVDDLRELLEAWLRYGIAGAEETSLAFWRDVSAHRALRDLVDRYSHYYVEVLGGILDDGIEAGTFRSIDTRALMLYWEAAAASMREPAYMARFRDLRPGRLASTWVDLVLNGVVRP